MHYGSCLVACLTNSLGSDDAIKDIKSNMRVGATSEIRPFIERNRLREAEEALDMSMRRITSLLCLWLNLHPSEAHFEMMDE